MLPTVRRQMSSSPMSSTSGARPSLSVLPALWRGGVIVDGHKVEELLKGRINAQWNWDARILRDGRYIIECPSAVIARQIEKAGKMESPAFTLEFTPWTTALYGPAKAEGALRWVLVKNLPMCFWDLESIARMLKPVGDLVLIGERGAHDTEDFRAFIRIRRPRRLPSAIHCSVSTLQHTYIVELEEGQPELPWSQHRNRGKEKSEPEGNKTPNQGPKRSPTYGEDLSPVVIRSKGKGPNGEYAPSPSEHHTIEVEGSSSEKETSLKEATAVSRQIRKKKKIGDGVITPHGDASIYFEHERRPDMEGTLEVGMERTYRQGGLSQRAREV
ncbi:hypothetical protein J5N97_013468 [Dioscorea zingiberensis]|uniref:DUF4283 domain-containing protein n=1 Tax=Dioscorea zingiberensis TaxID=325984 RepID=A0A9D5CRX2_9LILI|nr:hypothetical protein J5N97_013468 [Dioscorea zingiberensis]